MGKNKIGIGLITCDRESFFKIAEKSLSLIDKDVEIIIINDGNQIVDSKYKIINTPKPKSGVAIAKNTAFKYFLDKNYENIFLMEDDVEIFDGNIIKDYINTSKATGLKHLNFGLHGNHNRDPYGNPMVIKTINYRNGISIDLYPNVLGAFSYYHRSVLENVGLMPTCYLNALEHVDQTYKASLKGYTSPWRYFADVHDSSKYLKDIVPDHQQSKIRNNPNFQENFMKSLDIFIKNNGFSVVQGYGTPEKIISEKECIEKLKEIYKNNV